MSKTQNFTQHAHKVGASQRYETKQITSIKKPDCSNNPWIIYTLNILWQSSLNSSYISLVKGTTHNSRLFYIPQTNNSEKELRVRDSWITDQFPDPTIQNIGKLPSFTNRFFWNMMTATGLAPTIT